VCSVDVGSIGRTTYKLLSCDCVRVASQDPEEELAASNLLTELSRERERMGGRKEEKGKKRGKGRRGAGQLAIFKTAFPNVWHSAPR
jgi:hypothetical protein